MNPPNMVPLGDKMVAPLVAEMVSPLSKQLRIPYKGRFNLQLKIDLSWSVLSSVSSNVLYMPLLWKLFLVG